MVLLNQLDEADKAMKLGVDIVLLVDDEVVQVMDVAVEEFLLDYSSADAIDLQ